jgi:hypothetical protein
MNVLDEASGIVLGDRRKDYGTPLENHTRTADMVTAYLSNKLRDGVEITPEDVCMFNILQKVSRGANSITHDTLVDIAGYALNIELCQVKD